MYFSTPVKTDCRGSFNDSGLSSLSSTPPVSTQTGFFPSKFQELERKLNEAFGGTGQKFVDLERRVNDGFTEVDRRLQFIESACTALSTQQEEKMNAVVLSMDDIKSKFSIKGDSFLVLITT